MKKVIDEEKLFRDIMINGFSRGNHPTFQELLVVAKNIRQEKKYGEKNIIKTLGTFCLEQNENFNLVLSETILSKVAKVAIKNGAFRKPNFPIYISSDEMARIKNIKDLKIQMLILSSLVYAKSSGNPMLFSASNKDTREIIRLSGERVSVPFYIEDVTPVARVAGLFHHVANKHEFYSLSKESIGDVVLTISNSKELESLPDVFYKYNGGFPSWCKICGDEFLRDSKKHTRKVCKKCIGK